MVLIKGLHLHTFYTKPFKSIPLAQETWNPQELKRQMIKDKTKECDDSSLSIHIKDCSEILSNCNHISCLKYFLK